MKIFMFVNYTPSDKSLGITKKISSEIQAFRRLGHEVIYTAYGEDGVHVYDNNDTLVFEKKYLTHINTFVRYQRYFLLIRTAQAYIDECNKEFDIAYGRLLAPNNRYLHLFNTLKEKGSRVILEAHAYFPGITFQTLKGKYISYMLEKNGPKLKECVDRILTEGKIDSFYGIKEVREARIGVQTDLISAHNYIGDRNELHLISVANEMPYHAYDRVIKSLWNYYSEQENDKKICVHLVGSMSDETVSLIKRLRLEDYVFLYGKQYGSELDNIYNKCNMGLGPLGQHRIGGKKDTGLKTKEYFAKGLPYIYSGDEPSVPNNYPYIYKCPSDESLLDFNRIWMFYLSYRDISTVVEDMRKFALIQYSWENIMREAID